MAAVHSSSSPISDTGNSLSVLQPVSISPSTFALSASLAHRTSSVASNTSSLQTGDVLDLRWSASVPQSAYITITFDLILVYTPLTGHTAQLSLGGIAGTRHLSPTLMSVVAQPLGTSVNLTAGGCQLIIPDLSGLLDIFGLTPSQVVEWSVLPSISWVNVSAVAQYMLDALLPFNVTSLTPPHRRLLQEGSFFPPGLFFPQDVQGVREGTSQLIQNLQANNGPNWQAAYTSAEYTAIGALVAVAVLAAAPEVVAAVAGVAAYEGAAAISVVIGDVIAEAIGSDIAQNFATNIFGPELECIYTQCQCKSNPDADGCGDDPTAGCAALNGQLGGAMLPCKPPAGHMPKQKKPPAGSSTGDPWFTTFDGLYYGFQGVGVYTLVWDMRTGTWIQVELQPGFPAFDIDPFSAASRSPPNGDGSITTLTAGVALQDSAGCSVIEIRGHPGYSPDPHTGSWIDIYVDGALVLLPWRPNVQPLSNNALRTDCASIYRTSTGGVHVDTRSQYSLDIACTHCGQWDVGRTQSVVVVPPVESFNSTLGLLGSWDGNAGNDLTDWDGRDWGFLQPGSPGVWSFCQANSVQYWNALFFSKSPASYSTAVPARTQSLVACSTYVSSGAGEAASLVLACTGAAVNTSLSSNSTRRRLLQTDSTPPQSSGLNITSAMGVYNVSRDVIGTVPAVWPNVTMQALATLQCAEANAPLSSDSLSLERLSSCKADVYVLHDLSASAAFSATALTIASQQLLPPPNISVAQMATSGNELLLVLDFSSDSTEAGGLCSSLAVSQVEAVTTTSNMGEVVCLTVAQLALGNSGAYQPFALTTNSSLVAVPGGSAYTLATFDTSAQLVVRVQGLSPSTVYTVRAALQPAPNSTSSLILAQSLFTYLTFITAGCVPTCISAQPSSGVYSCGSDGCGGSCGVCPASLPVCNINTTYTDVLGAVFVPYAVTWSRTDGGPFCCSATGSSSPSSTAALRSSAGTSTASQPSVSSSSKAASYSSSPSPLLLVVTLIIICGCVTFILIVRAHDRSDFIVHWRSLIVLICDELCVERCVVVVNIVGVVVICRCPRIRLLLVVEPVAHRGNCDRLCGGWLGADRAVGLLCTCSTSTARRQVSARGCSAHQRSCNISLDRERGVSRRDCRVSVTQ